MASTSHEPITNEEKQYFINNFNALRGNVEPTASSMRYMEFKRNERLKNLTEHQVIVCDNSEHRVTFSYKSEQRRYYGIIASRTKEGIFALYNKGKMEYNFDNAACPSNNYFCIRYWEGVVEDASYFYCSKGKGLVDGCYTYACALEINNKMFQNGVKPYEHGEQCSQCYKYQNHDRCLEGVCATETQCSSRPSVTCRTLEIPKIPNANDESGVLRDLENPDGASGDYYADIGKEDEAYPLRSSTSSIITKGVSIWLLILHALPH